MRAQNGCHSQGRLDLPHWLSRNDWRGTFADNVYRGFEPLTAEDVANAVMYALLQPKHVQVADVVVLATRQSGAKNIARAQQ